MLPFIYFIGLGIIYVIVVYGKFSIIYSLSCGVACTVIGVIYHISLATILAILTKSN